MQVPGKNSGMAWRGTGSEVDPEVGSGGRGGSVEPDLLMRQLCHGEC